VLVTEGLERVVGFEPDRPVRARGGGGLDRLRGEPYELEGPALELMAGAAFAVAEANGVSVRPAAPGAAGPSATAPVARPRALMPSFTFMATAMAANNEDAFQQHNFNLHKLGVSREDRIKAVNISLRIKMAPHNSLSR